MRMCKRQLSTFDRSSKRGSSICVVSLMAHQVRAATDEPCRALLGEIFVKKPHRNDARAARPRWSARSCVLGRANNAAIHAPCVLGSHSTIAPGQRVVIPERLLRAADGFGRGVPTQELLEPRLD